MRIRSMYLTALVMIVLFSACNRTWRSSRMFKAKKDYEYTTEVDSTAQMEFRIEPNDIIDFRLFTNDGFKLIDLSTLNDAQNLQQQRANFFYLVEHDGMVKMPMIGRVDLSGMTIKEAEEFLQDKYAKYYIDPFARITVENRRVIVFTGDYSQGRVVEMPNRNLRLIEALAQAGGLPRSGKAHMIKVLRGDPVNPDVYHFDLSKIDGFEASTFVLQSNDVIYVEPRIVITSEFIRDYLPVLTLITSLITLYVLVVGVAGN